MSGSVPHGLAPESPLGIRALPPSPNLEFERKQARKLLRRLRAGDADAAKRFNAQWREHSAQAQRDFRLADAQLVIAREYGFRSWPRLVEYFTALDRHERSGKRTSSEGAEHYERLVQTVLAEHRNRSPVVAGFLATFVPRFYGLGAGEVLAATVTEDDARLVVARQSRFPSWEALLGHESSFPQDPWSHYASPFVIAAAAVRRDDLSSLKLIVAEHPELLQRAGPDAEAGHPLMRSALMHEMRARGERARETTDWLVANGVDAQETLDRMLTTFLRTSAPEVEYCLKRGADPAGVPPNGIPVLEHALLRYWNRDAVDLIARRVKPRKAFWIAAGLGDTGELKRYFDRNGSLRDSARRDRPDFTAVGPAALPSLRDADDLTIVWEAFFVAGLNCRTNSLDALLERGFPIDHAPWGSTLLHFAVGNGMAPLVEFLVSRGADLDLKGRRPHASAREMAEEYFASDPSNEDRRHILTLCGARDADSVLLARKRESERPIQFTPNLTHALELAKEEAVRLGQTNVEPHNIFVAMLRDRPGLVLGLLAHAGADVSLLRRSIAQRLEAGLSADDVRERDVPYSESLDEVLTMAATAAEERHRRQVGSLHVLFALSRIETGSVADLLREAGTTPAEVRDACSSAL